MSRDDNPHSAPFFLDHIYDEFSKRVEKEHHTVQGFIEFAWNYLGANRPAYTMTADLSLKLLFGDGTAVILAPPVKSGEVDNPVVIPVTGPGTYSVDYSSKVANLKTPDMDNQHPGVVRKDQYPYGDLHHSGKHPRGYYRR